MLWFYRYRWVGATNPGLLQQQVARAAVGDGLTYTEGDDGFTIVAPRDGHFRNSWNPTLFGRVRFTATGAELVAYYRPRLAVLGLTLMWLGFALYQMWWFGASPAESSAIAANGSGQYRNPASTMLFLLVVVNVIGWLVSLPNARRIAKALEQAGLRRV